VIRSLLVVSGLDPSGGAGFLADAAVAREHGLRPVGVITAVTVQDTAGVRAAWPTPPDVVGDALETLLGDVEVHAVKIGMLGEARTAQVIARALAATRAPVVWDPVLRPSRGGVALLEGDPQAAARALLPEVRLVTPNAAEAQVLSGVRVVDADSARAAARVIRAQAVLVKGGHLGGDRARDHLRDGDAHHVLESPRVEAGELHGTGCVLSSAIAARLALGEPLLDAVSGAKRWLDERLSHVLAVGRGAAVLI
jgi:hydroxymethylpyrimidine/phosphomethylpyrimidine kinase